jgi:hypothetical protein
LLGFSSKAVAHPLTLLRGGFECGQVRPAASKNEEKDAQEDANTGTERAYVLAV